MLRLVRFDSAFDEDLYLSLRYLSDLNIQALKRTSNSLAIFRYERQHARKLVIVETAWLQPAIF